MNKEELKKEFEQAAAAFGERCLAAEQLNAELAALRQKMQELRSKLASPASVESEPEPPAAA